LNQSPALFYFCFFIRETGIKKFFNVATLLHLGINVVLMRSGFKNFCFSFFLSLIALSKLKKIEAMATAVALPDSTKYPTFNVNKALFTLVGHGKTACSFIRCRPNLTTLEGGF